MKAYCDATVLIGLGRIGELRRLSILDAAPIVLPAVRGEVTTEPASTVLEQALEADTLALQSNPCQDRRQTAAAMLDEPTETADVHLIAAVLDDIDTTQAVAIISDDTRIRTVARGLGATVTGTIGVVIRAVDHGLDPDEATAIVRRLDQHGLHTTATLRERAERLIDEASGSRAENR